MSVVRRASCIVLRPSAVVRRRQFALNDIFTITTGSVLTKLHRNNSKVTLYKHSAKPKSEANFCFIGGQNLSSFNSLFACNFTFYILYIALNQLVLNSNESTYAHIYG